MKAILSLFIAITLNATIVLAEESKAAGNLLWDQRCGACHSLNPPPKIGPPARGIVMNYASQYSTREDFAKAVSKWTLHPQKENSLMPHAIERFGMMPPLVFEEKELQEIGRWMWDQFR